MNNKAHLMTRVILSTTAITLFQSHPMAADPITAEINVSTGKIATANTERQIIISSGNSIHKTGDGILNITATQGQTTGTPSAQDGLSGTIVLDAGAIRVGHNDALGNGQKYSGSNTAVASSDNTLLMHDRTILSASNTITGLSVPVLLDNNSSSSFFIDCNNHTFKLNQLKANDNQKSNPLTVNFINSNNSPTLSEVTLNTDYTKSSNNDRMVVSSYVNFKTDTLSKVTNTVLLYDQAKFSITESINLPKLIVQQFYT